MIDDAAWVVTGYLLAYTISMTFMGRVSDLIGRRRVYIACLIIFMIGSVVVAEVDPQAQHGVAGLLYNVALPRAGARPDAGSVALMTIIIGRVIQALGAGALVPVSLALVGDLFPAAQARAAARRDRRGRYARLGAGASLRRDHGAAVRRVQRAVCRPSSSRSA